MKIVLFKNGIEKKVSEKIALKLAFDLNAINQHTKIWNKNGSIDCVFVLSEIVAIY